MKQTIAWPALGLVLMLGACASRPPEPVAESAPPAAPAPALAKDDGASRGAAGNPAPSGAISSSATAAPADRVVYFEFDSSTLSPQAQTVVQQNARYAQPRQGKVRLEGNADERGSREYNLALGQRRADAVRQAMELSGLRGEAVDAVSYGEERPRCTEHTESCYATNRRVEILVGP
jgi:peptidoglycan-associated lipoprotein